MIGDQITPGPHQLRLNFYDQETGDRILSRVYTGSANDGQFSATLQTDITYRIDVTVCCNAPTVTITFSDLSFSEDTILDLTVPAVEVIFEVVDADGAAVPDAVIAVPSASGSNQRATWTARVFADPTDESGETSALLPVGTASDPSPRPTIAMTDGVKTTFSFPALADTDDPDPLGPTIPETTIPETTIPEVTTPEVTTPQPPAAETTEFGASTLPTTSSTAVSSESTTTADGAVSTTTTSPTSTPSSTDPIVITPLSSTSTTTASTNTTLTTPTSNVPLLTTTSESASQPVSGTTTPETTTTTAGSTTETTPTATTEAVGGATQQSTTQQSTTQQSTTQQSANTVPDAQPSSTVEVATTEIVSLIADEAAVEQASTTVTTTDSPVPATIEPTGSTFALTTMPTSSSTSEGTATTPTTGIDLTTTTSANPPNPDPATTTSGDPVVPETTTTTSSTSETTSPPTTGPTTTGPATTGPATTTPATTEAPPAGPTITTPTTTEPAAPSTTTPSATTTVVPTTGPPPLGPIIAEPAGDHVVRIVLLAPVGIDVTGFAGLEVLGEIAPGSHSLRVSFYRQDIDELAARVTYTGDNNDGTYTVRLIAGVLYRAEVTICCEGPTVKLTFDDLSFDESTTADLLVRGAEVNIRIVNSEGDAVDSAVVEFTGLAGLAETIEIGAGPGVAWTADGSPDEDSDDGVFPTILPVGSITSPLLAESDDDVPAAAVSIDNGDPIAFAVPDIVFNANTVTVTVSEEGDSTGSELSVTRPWIVPTIDQEKNDEGWISQPAQITWEVTDPTPSVGLTEIDLPPTVVEAEGKKTYYSEEACDLDDNCSVGKLEVWLDSKAPTVGIYGFVDGKLRGAEPNATCTSSDTHSGLVDECEIETIAILSEATDDQDGWITTYEVTAIASDFAGNVTEVVKTYKIETSDPVEVPITTTIPAPTTVPESTTTSDPGTDSTTTQPTTSSPTASEPTTTDLSPTTTTGTATTTETSSPFDLSGSSPSSSSPQTTNLEPVTTDATETTETGVAEPTTSTAATGSTPTTTSAQSSTTVPGSTPVDPGDSTTVPAPSEAAPSEDVAAQLETAAALQSESGSSLVQSGLRVTTLRR